MKKCIALFSLLSFINSTIVAQQLRPGFDKSQCIELLTMGAAFGDSSYVSLVPPPPNFKLIYRSPIVGMVNMWDLWMNNQGVAVISLRGTTKQAVSWLENFYSAMIPAKGSLHLNDSTIFQYDLGSNPRAAVHVGWMTGIAFLSKDVLFKIDSLAKAGIKDFIITGHSQGGALSFLMTSWLYSLREKHRLPADIRFKTYSFASPKVGNTYYAYDYEAMTQYGWAFNVVNSADWVPETMFSIQTVDDFNNSNPFINAKAHLSKLPFPKDLVLKYVYNQLDKPSRKAEYRFQECLGKGLETYVKKAIPGFQPPVYVNSMNYARAGTPIILLGDSTYFKKFPDNPNTPFVHHLHAAYYYLALLLPDTSP